MDIKVKREYVAYDGKVFDSQESALKHEDELNREKVYFDSDEEAYGYISGGVEFCEFDHDMNGYRLKQALVYLKKWYDAYMADKS